jgi:hypothetical protein
MTELEAIRIVSRYAPCPHDEHTVPLGTGERHRCDKCGVTFDPATPHIYRERTRKFEEAIDVLNRLLAEADEMEGCLIWYVREDDTNMGNPQNEHWIEGKRRAMRALKMEET